MIKLSGSRFTDIMPENLAEQPEIQALAYAVGRQVEKLLAYADGARTYAAIYAVPEKVLDLSTPPAEVFVGHWIHTGDFITLQRATM